MATIARNAEAANGNGNGNGTLPKVRGSPSSGAPEQLTHYHSYFTSLLSWENPRSSAIAFSSTIVFIIAARYLDILRYAFKITWMTLGVTVLAEIIGKATISQGLTSQFRPRKYYMVSKETLESLVSDACDLINFFVIESQRILFAENVYVSTAAFFASFISYYLVKIVPYWGLALLGTSILFLGPLVYKTNQEFIDHYVRQASEAVNEQAEHVKQAAAQRAAQATEAARLAASEYSAKAQEMINRGRSVSPIVSKSPKSPGKSEADIPSVHVSEPDTKSESEESSAYEAGDLPNAPNSDIKHGETPVAAH
ncbi:putative Reticulon-like protein 1 [Xylogone sp. PMI_703]|nr:putative Reticulon-like protein 1 [Xylogone sp. PMI_703]